MDAYERAVAWATEWSQRWFLDANGRDQFRVAGIDAGWASHVDAFQVLSRYALGQIGDRADGRPALRERAKAAGWDRAIRAVGLRLLESRRKAKSRGEGLPPVALVVEVPTPSMMRGLALVGDQLGERGLLGTTDPRAFRALRELGLHPHSLVPSSFRSTLRDARREIERGWDAVLRAGEPMVLDEDDLRHGALTALHPLVRRSMPWVAAEALGSREFLARHAPVSVGIASDQHRVGRILSQLATEAGIPTVVLQHGLPQAPIGYLPVVAPVVAAWSEASVDWFVGGGTDPERLRVTGNPRFDEYVVPNEAAARTDGGPRLLLALSPNAGHVNRAVLQQAVGAVESLSDARLVVKLHPGQGSWQFVKEVVQQSSAVPRIEVQRYVPLAPLLQWAEVTIVHRSTVAVDSLAAGTPVVIARAGGVSLAEMRELVDLHLPAAERADELARLITSLRGGAKDYFGERETAIHRLTGPVDGHSAARIADLLAVGGATASRRV